MGLIGGVVLASTEFGYPNSLVRGLSRLPARSALLPSAEVSTGHPRPLKPRRKVVLMRSRNIQIPLRLSEEEYAVLMKKVGKCRCSRESYIRSLINGFSPKEAPPVDYYKILSKISRESANLNQLLIVARTKNFIDTPQLRKLMEEIRATNKMLWQTFSEERNGNH